MASLHVNLVDGDMKLEPIVRQSLRITSGFVAGFAVACAIGWDISPKYVDSETGILKEPFALVILFHLAVPTSVALAGLSVVPLPKNK
jgi:hypothetical protein